ncbi:MAG: acetolactate synthase small subunit [Bacteroidales bacterium]|nr:acetolactate synthase small subunit [Bacteroidales bacterium]
METKQYTIAVYTENHIGLLNKITITFTRRKINIESLTVSESEIAGIHSFVIVVNTTKSKIEKLVKQLEKLVEVFKAFYYTDDQIVAQEIALYKMPISAITGGIDMGKIIRKSGARILEMQEDYFVIEQTGTKEETTDLLNKLKPFGILEFNRSGRIMASRPMKRLEDYIEEKNEAHYYTK